MKKQYQYLIILAVFAVLAFVVYKKRKSTTKNKKSTTTTTAEDTEAVAIEDSVTLEELYNPHYTVSESFDHSITGGGSEYGYVTIDNTKSSFRISKERMEEIMYNIELFVDDLCNVPEGFKVSYIQFFTQCNNEELRFVKYVISKKGYVMTDASGNKVIIEGLDDVFADPLQKQRPGASQWNAVLSKLQTVD